MLLFTASCKIDFFLSKGLLLAWNMLLEMWLFVYIITISTRKGRMRMGGGELRVDQNTLAPG